MTITEWESKLNELKQVLAERLPYNKNWENVCLKIKKTYLEIRWFGSKKEDVYDPKGKMIFKSTRIAPLNKANLWEEVKRQKIKLERDKKREAKDSDVE